MSLAPLPDPTFWRGKRVFVTGHTGFKGGWLTLLLTELGAEVHGYALAPPTKPSLFDVTGLHARLGGHTQGDLRDAARLAQAVRQARPDILLHLAAQALVRPSYDNPLETLAVNVLGTAHVLEAVRHTSCVRAVINVTSDKCYENREWLWPYRENEALGGADPYSASKACAELVGAAYRTAFLADAGVHVASARAGNVIGGGDWAADRLVPDFLRAIDAERPLSIRSPAAIRPWQHVLEALAGYLLLAERLFAEDGAAYAEAWNFGPADEDARPVCWVVEYLCSRVPGARWQCDTAHHPHEAHTLKLDSAKARTRLGWRPRWRLEEALKRTLDWHLAWRAGADMAEYSLGQVRAYLAEALPA